MNLSFYALHKNKNSMNLSFYDAKHKNKGSMSSSFLKEKNFIFSLLKFT